MRDEAEPVRVPVPRRLLERPAALRCDRAVLVAHRARDPRHVVVRDQAGERGDETAAAALRDAVLVRDRSPVRDDEELAPFRCPSDNELRGRLQPLHEPKPRTPLAGPRRDLELVGDRPDDRDAETAFAELAPSAGAGTTGSKPSPSSTTSISSALADSSYAMETKPSPPGYAWRTELETASVSASLRSATSSSDSGASSATTGEREPGEGDVLGAGRDAQPNRPARLEPFTFRVHQRNLAHLPSLLSFSADSRFQT